MEKPYKAIFFAWIIGCILGYLFLGKFGLAIGAQLAWIPCIYYLLKLQE